MFIKSPTYSRSHSPHYRFWRWTYQNHIWYKPVPDSFQTSLCLYWQRMFWIGILILPLLHILYFTFVPLLYSLLYKRLVKPIIKYDLGAALVITSMVLGTFMILGIEVLPIVLLVVISFFVGIVAGCMLLAWLAQKLGKYVLGPIWRKVLGPILAFLLLVPVFKVLEFDWQVYRRHYNRRHPLPDCEYNYNGGRSQLLIHILFWIQPIILFFVFHFGGQAIIQRVPPELLGYGASWGLWFVLAWITLGLIINFFVNRHYDKQADELYYEMHPEKRPYRVRKQEFNYEPSRWTKFRRKMRVLKDDFHDWRHAVKEKVCPLVEFTD